MRVLEWCWEWWPPILLEDLGTWIWLSGPLVVNIYHPRLSFCCLQPMSPTTHSITDEGNDAEKVKRLAQDHTAAKWQSPFTSSCLEILNPKCFELHWASEKQCIPFKPCGCKNASQMSGCRSQEPFPRLVHIHPTQSHGQVGLCGPVVQTSLCMLCMEASLAHHLDLRVLVKRRNPFVKH